MELVSNYIILHEMGWRYGWKNECTLWTWTPDIILNPPTEQYN